MHDLELATVGVRVSERVAWITLNRPEALNAWTPQLGRDLGAALGRVADAADVRSVVLTGAGRAFSSGADLKSGGLVGEDGRPDVGTPLREIYHPVILAVRTLAKPVVAAVNGPAVGIGCSLALACDLVIAPETALLPGWRFANVALGLDGGASATLVARVGLGRATEIAMLADRIPAAQALGWGLVNRVVTDDQLRPAAAELAVRLAAGSPGSHATIKRTLNEATYPRLADLLELEAQLQQERAESADFIEAVNAFVEKRSPSFSGT